MIKMLSRGLRLSVIFSMLFFTSYSQLTIVDTGDCLNRTLHATVTGTLPTGTGITADDGYSGVFPIGFTFNFYGTNYTQLVIGSNGVINFNLALAGGYCPWPITAALLGNANMRNAICGPWCDILISAGGSITYSTAGVAPNRKFAVTWCGSRMYSCTTQWTTSQIILYETSNLIEVHTANKTICAWNGGYAITGVHNAAGTAATVAPGRDFPSVWSVTSPPEAWRFTPVGAGTSYTVASIPHAPLPYATSAVYWYDSTTGAYLGSGPYLTVAPPVPTTYKAVALGCNDSVRAYMTVMPPSVGVGGIPRITGYDTLNPSECGMCDGKIVLRGVNPHQIDTVFWSFNGVPQPSYVDSAALDSTITLDNLCGGTYDYIYVKVGDCPSNQVGPIRLVTPVLAVSGIEVTNPSVCGRSDGSIKLKGLTPLKTVSVAYSKGGVPQPPQTGIVAADSTFVLTGLEAGNYTGISATINLCTAPAPAATLVDPPPYVPTFTYNLGYGCQGDTIFVTNTTTPTGYFSYWNWGDGSPLDSTSVYHIFSTHTATPKYTGTYTVTLNYNTTPWRKPACNATVTANITIDHRLTAAFNPEYDTVCRGVDLKFLNTSFSNYSPKYYWLFGDGFYDDDSTEPVHAYAQAGNYPVSLTVTDSFGCVEKANANVEVISIDLYSDFHDTDVCLRQPFLINLRTDVKRNANMVVNYTWTQTPAGANLDNYNIANPSFSGIGDYTVNVTATTTTFLGNPNYCEANEQMVIRSHPPVSITNVTANPTIIKVGTSIRLNADGGEFYKWYPANGVLDNPNINNPVATLFDSVTNFKVLVMNKWGCLDSAFVTIYTDQETYEFVPTAFTPNGDGKNDIFRMIRLGIQKLVDFRVYNRWGEMMFQTSNPEIGWDGTYKGQPQDIGTYIYEIIVALPNGENKVHKGNVTLIR